MPRPLKPGSLAKRSPCLNPRGGVGGKVELHAIDYLKVSFKHFNTQLAQKSLRDLEKEKKNTLTLTGNKC